MIKLETNISGVHNWGLFNIEFGEHRMPALMVEDYLASLCGDELSIQIMDNNLVNQSLEFMDDKAQREISLARQSDHLWLYYIILSNSKESLLYHIFNYNMTYTKV